MAARALAMFWKSPWTLVPIAVTDRTITIEVSPAIRLYSIAVTPDSSFRKRTNNVFIRDQ